MYRLDTHFCSDYKATVTWIGKPGQSTCTCLHGSCGAKENKEIAAIPAISCPLFTAQSHAADLARFNQLTYKKPVNGVSKPALMTLDPRRVHPPYLHLILGLGNDEATAITNLLKSHDSMDPALTAALEASAEALGDEELTLMAVIDGAAAMLGQEHALFKQLITDDIGVLVGQKSLDQWQQLSEALKEAAAGKAEAATTIRYPTLPAGQVRSSRQQRKDAGRAKVLEDSAKLHDEAATAVTESVASVAKARAAVKEKEAAIGLHANSEGEKPKGGVLYLEWKAALRAQGICIGVTVMSAQLSVRFWKTGRKFCSASELKLPLFTARERPMNFINATRLFWSILPW